MMATSIIDKNLKLTIESDETLLIEAQPELLRTLIGTILDNAIKYTPQNGDISVTMAQNNTIASISITDSGEGIPEMERSKVFDRFYRISGSKQPGSGLGLAIASQIAELLNADIRMETPENGPRFTCGYSFSPASIKAPVYPSPSFWHQFQAVRMRAKKLERWED